MTTGNGHGEQLTTPSLHELAAVLTRRGWLCDHKDSEAMLHGSSWVRPASTWPELAALGDSDDPYQEFTRITLGEDPWWCVRSDHEVWVDLVGAHPSRTGEGWHFTRADLLRNIARIEAHHPLSPDPFPELTIAARGCQPLTDDTVGLIPPLDMT